jgi:hypothetical protein
MIGGIMSRIFEDYAQEFFEYGLQPVPVEPNTKACMITGHSFFSKKLTQDTLDEYIASHGGWDIGIVCGQFSGVIGIDFDYVGFEDSELIENMLIGGLPPTPAIKRGGKGWTRFYKYNPIFSQTRNLKRLPPGETEEKTFIDILSNKKITVMPPSRHSKDKVYEWIGTKHLVDCLEELPELSGEHLAHIEYVWKFELSKAPVELTASAKDMSRHGKLFGFVMKTSNYEKGLDELTRKALEYDDLVNASNRKGPYFKDKKNIGHRKPDEAARHFVERICKWKAERLKEKGISWEIGKTSTSYWHNAGTDEKPKWIRSEKYSDFVNFFSMKYPTARKDFISKIVQYKAGKDALWSPVENELEALKSYCHEVGLNQNHVKTNLDRWCQSLEPKPLFDINPWDGKDHLGDAIRFIKFKNLDTEVAAEIFKDWFAGIFKRLENPSKANRLIVLRGEQGKGKDWWVNHVLSGFGAQHGEISINGRNKIENYTTLYGLITGYISEFDETKAVPIGMLKSLITNRSAMFRLPYDKRAVNREMKYSLIASVNETDVLRDTTGNRRFIIFDIDEIDWSYQQKIDPQKLLDHGFHLYKHGYSASEQSEAVIREKIADETPISSEELFVEEIVHALRQASSMSCGRKIRWPNISKDVENIAKKYNFSMQTAQKIMNKHGFRCQDALSTFYALPKKYADNLSH